MPDPDLQIAPLYKQDGSPISEKRLKELLLKYEVASSWWAGYISASWLQDLASRYFTWKVRYKYERWAKYALWKCSTPNQDT